MRIFLLSLILFTVNACNEPPPDAGGWYQGVPFAVPVDCQWDDDLLQLPHADLAVLQGVLKEAFAIAAKHGSAATPSIFNLNGAPLVSHRISIILTGRDVPQLYGTPLPAEAAAMSGIALTAEDSVTGAKRIFVFLKLGQTALDSRAPFQLRSDAVGVTALAMGHTLFGSVPVTLANSATDNHGREVAIAQTSIGFFERVVADPSVSYANRMPAYWGLVESRRRLLAARHPVAAAPPLLALPMSMAYVDKLEPGAGPIPQGTAMPPRVAATVLPVIERALHFVHAYPPDGVWNNAFSWNPNTAAVIADKLLHLVLSEIPLKISDGGARAMASPLNPTEIWGGTDDFIGVGPTGPVLGFSLAIQLRRCMFDPAGNLLPDALARTIALLGGELYGPIQRLLATDPKKAPVVDLDERSTVQLGSARRDLRARRAGLEMLDRFMASYDFTTLPEAEQATFAPVRERTECAVQLLQTHLLEQN